MKKLIGALLLLIGNLNAAINENNLHICTIASHLNQELAQLLDSCRRFDVDIDILGLGLPYRGNGQKLIQFQKFLERFEDYEVAVLVDAYDLLILASKKTILEKFLSKNVPCIISAETNCYPFGDLAHRFPNSPTPFKYINTGTIIGYVGHLKRMIQNMSPISEADDDQGQWMKYYVNHQDEIVLDYYCEFAIPMFQVELSDLKINKATSSVDCLLTGTTPMMVHGNSPWTKGLYQHIYNVLFK